MSTKKLIGGGARNRTAVLRLPLQVLIPVETYTTPLVEMGGLLPPIYPVDANGEFLAPSPY